MESCEESSVVNLSTYGMFSVFGSAPLIVDTIVYFLGLFGSS
jgi:hypothetical protein